MKILEADNLCKNYGKGSTLVKAIDNVSFTVDEGSKLIPILVSSDIFFFIFSISLSILSLVVFLVFSQIVNGIEKYVAVGILKEKVQIPSIREMASNLGINPNTVKKSYDILENKRNIINSFNQSTTFTIILTQIISF